MEKEFTTHLSNDSDDFYFMINPYFPTPDMYGSIKDNIEHLIKNYPSDQKTIASKIRQIENIDSNMPLIAVNGSSESIRVFMQNYAKKALVTVPNFNEWEITDHIGIAHDATNEEIVGAIEEHRVDTVCFCNPNNPTGYYRDDIQSLVDKFPKVNFVIDISFIDFVDATIPEYPHGKNVILVKSLGKNYGICGIRIGYISSKNQELIDDMVKKIPIWNINSVCEHLLDLILENRGIYEESRIKTIEGVRDMQKMLEGVDYLRVYSTKANFIMVKSEKPLNFKVKNCANKTGLDGTYYRLAYNSNYHLLKDLLNNN